jgi:hypothetical protein
MSSLVGATDCGPQQQHRFGGLEFLFASHSGLAACLRDKSKELGRHGLSQCVLILCTMRRGGISRSQLQVVDQAA